MTTIASSTDGITKPIRPDMPVDAQEWKAWYSAGLREAMRQRKAPEGEAEHHLERIIIYPDK
jgi:hypothetical protein